MSPGFLLLLHITELLLGPFVTFIKGMERLQVSFFVFAKETGQGEFTTRVVSAFELLLKAEKGWPPSSFASLRRNCYTETNSNTKCLCSGYPVWVYQGVIPVGKYLNGAAFVRTNSLHHEIYCYSPFSQTLCGHYNSTTLLLQRLLKLK